jgi:hypothetical protein
VSLELILRLPGPSKSEFRVNSHDQAKSARSPYSQNHLALKAESRKILLCYDTQVILEQSREPKNVAWVSPRIS